MQFFFSKIAEISETNVERISLALPIDGLEAWDSTAAISFLVYAKTEWDVELTGYDLIDIVTVGDLYGLLLERTKQGAGGH